MAALGLSHSMWSSSLPRGQGRAPCTGRAVLAMDPQGSPGGQCSHPGHPWLALPRSLVGYFLRGFTPPLLTPPWLVTSASAWRTPQVPCALPPGSLLLWSPPQHCTLFVTSNLTSVHILPLHHHLPFPKHGRPQLLLPTALCGQRNTQCIDPAPFSLDSWQPSGSRLLVPPWRQGTTGWLKQRDLFSRISRGSKSQIRVVMDASAVVSRLGLQMVFSVCPHAIPSSAQHLNFCLLHGCILSPPHFPVSSLSLSSSSEASHASQMLTPSTFLPLLLTVFLSSKFRSPMT